MGMIKIVDPAGWNWDRPIAQMVKVSSRGLVGSDRSAFIKTASPMFLDMIDRVKVAKDEVPVHLIALGASEAYGPNRNGDGFKEATCKQHHKTFEKFARWYRNHVNKDPKKSYGYIKQAEYNNPMRRVELLVMLNATKEAAERNGGFVADTECEKLAAGEDIPVSMACRVPYDVCSGCGNKARTRDDYCKAASCKYGGCADNLTKVASDGHILHVDNPNPTWFDISRVFRPADRIAYGGKADYLQKAASHGFMKSAELADALGITAPLNVILSQDEPYHWSAAVHGQIKLAHGLAALERNGSGLTSETRRGLRSVNRISSDQFNVFGSPGTEKAAHMMHELAVNHVFLPLEDFARWIGKEASIAGARQLVGGVFGELAGQSNLQDMVVRNPFIASAEKKASAVQTVLAKNLVTEYSLNADAVRHRAMKSAMRNEPIPDSNAGIWNEKIASDDTDAVNLARLYGLYKLAALYAVSATDQNFELTARLAVGQNGI